MRSHPRLPLPLSPSNCALLTRSRHALRRPYIHRPFHSSSPYANVPSWPNPPTPQPVVTPYDNSGGNDRKVIGDGQEKKTALQELAASPFVQAGITTVVGLIMVFVGGVGYLQWYKAHVLDKMEDAFAPGYDPALELGTLKHRNKPPSESSMTSTEEHNEHIRRKEQPFVDRIVRGEESGSYFLIVGSKVRKIVEVFKVELGTGKGTMIIDAMQSIRAEGSAFCEAHPDLEVFRLRLGKALNYEYNEDSQGSLFSRRDPREGGPALDIERAMNKLEKVALRYTKKKGRPLVLAFNNVHLFPNDKEGHALLHQLQQRAEAWAEAGICTMILSTDDFWCLDTMKKNASRMRILSVYDLPRSEALRSLRYLRRLYRPQAVTESAKPVESDEQLESVLDLIGGRTSYMMRVARSRDMLAEAKYMVQSEKAWLLSKIGLIPDHDDDVMDEQKWSTCSWLLLRAFVQKAEAQAKEVAENPSVELASKVQDTAVSYYRARQIMTRPDFLADLDHANIISIDVDHDVRPDSILLLQAAKEVVQEEGFDDMLDDVRNRVDEIEGLHRQNELTIKEPFSVKLGGGSWLFGSSPRVIEVQGLGASFVPAKEKDDEERV